MAVSVGGCQPRQLAPALTVPGTEELRPKATGVVIAKPPHFGKVPTKTRSCHGSVHFPESPPSLVDRQRNSIPTPRIGKKMRIGLVKYAPLGSRRGWT